MKLTRTKSGTKITISKKEWKSIAKKAGWDKESESKSYKQFIEDKAQQEGFDSVADMLNQASDEEIRKFFLEVDLAWKAESE